MIQLLSALMAVLQLNMSQLENKKINLCSFLKVEGGVGIQLFKTLIKSVYIGVNLWQEALCNILKKFLQK